MNSLQYNVIKDITNVTPALILNSGDIKFVSPEKNIIGVCSNLKLNEFKKEVTLLNTNEFLSILSTMGIDSKIDVHYPNINIKNKNNTTVYVTDNAEYINDDIKQIDGFLNKVSNDYKFNFNLPVKELDKIIKLHSILNLSSISIKKDNNEVILNAYSDDMTASSYTVSLPCTGDDYSDTFSVDIESLTKLYKTQDLVYNIHILDGLIKVQCDCIPNIDNKMKETELLKEKDKIDDKKYDMTVKYLNKFKDTTITYYIAGQIKYN